MMPYLPPNSMFGYSNDLYQDSYLKSHNELTNYEKQYALPHHISESYSTPAFIMNGGVNNSHFFDGNVKM